MANDILLSIPGMMCGGCVSTIEGALKDQAGISKVEISLESKTAKVDAELPVAEIISMIKAAGYDATQIE